jgi:hypothetical protein
MSSIPLCTLRRGLCDYMQHTCTTVNLRADGNYELGYQVVLDELTPDELAEYHRDLAEGEAMAAFYADGEPAPTFRTLEDAIEYGEALQAHSDADCDLHLFHAPSECYRDAMPPHEARLEAALGKAV